MGRIRSSNRAETPHDAAFAIDPATDSLLLNWARWQAGRAGGAAGVGVCDNSMWRFASRGSRDVPCTVGVPVDIEQARRVEVVVCNPGFSPKFRDLLKAHYIVNVHPSRTCAALGLHHAAYAEWIWRATVFFGNRYQAAYSHQHRIQA